MHELHVRVAGGREHVRRDRVGGEQRDALVPDVLGLAHGHPHVGVDEVGAAHARRHVLGEGHPGTAHGGEPVGLGHHRLVRPQGPRRHDPHVHAQQRAGDQQRVTHVGAGVAEVGVGDLRQRLGAVLGHGQHVGEHLGGVPLVGQAVEDRHPGVRGELLDGLLGAAPVLDAVEHPAEHPRGVADGLLVADLGAGGVQVGGGGALVGGGDLEGAAGAGGGLLEDQRDVPPAQPLLLGARALVGLQPCGQVHQVAELLGREVQLLEKVAARQVDGHKGTPRSSTQYSGTLYDGPYPYAIVGRVTGPPPRAPHTGSRSIGQLMQRGPPRPRPSSLPGMVITSMPRLRRKVLVVALRS